MTVEEIYNSKSILPNFKYIINKYGYENLKNGDNVYKNLFFKVVYC